MIGGYSYGDELDRYMMRNPKTFDVLNSNNALELQFKKLLAGRLDAVLESSVVAEAKLAEMQLSKSKIKAAGQLADTHDVYIACAPNSSKIAQYLQWIDEGTAELRTTGQLNYILQRYGLNDWQK